ncbi:MAG: type II secretion system protein J [Dehalococcoidales bacterium]
MIKVKNSQKGFTLVEILVVMAVSGVLLVGIVVAIFQTVRVTTGSSTQITALENIKSCAYAINKDVRMAATANLSDGAPPVDYLILDWRSWYDENGELSPVDHHCKYYLSGGELQRNYDDTDIRTVARYISDIQFSFQDPIILVTITASPEGKPETAEQETYHMYLQPKEEPVQ